MSRSIFPAILLALLYTACTQNEAQDQSSQEAWPEGAVAYEIFVQSFADADGDSIGDFEGLTAKLDYIKDLGADAIWLMPIMESPSYHKYDVTDYKSVHPDYGTMEEFKNMVKEAHNRDIKVIVDFIINHTSSEHPWFQNAKQGPDAEYRDYYVWADRDSVAEQIAKKTTSFDSDNITQWHAVDGDTTAEHYYGFFYGGMPDLNYDNPEVRKEIYDIGRFWLEEVGVDGFRMDAAKHIFPDDRPQDNHAFWAEFKKEMEKVKPDVYIVGEVWADTETQLPYIKGFTSLFNFDLGYSILETIQTGKPATYSVSGEELNVDSTRTFIDMIISNNEQYETRNPDYVDAIFLSNHDQNRVMSVLDNDEDKAKLAASILLTLPGTPYLYYGEEIGMKGMKPDPNIREPFLWKPKPEDELRALWMEPKYTTDSTVTPLSIQKQNDNSIFNHYKALITTRKENVALSLGELLTYDLKNQQLLSYLRAHEGEKLLVVHNLSNTDQKIAVANSKDLIYGDNQWLENGSLPGHKSIIVRLAD